MFQPSAPNWRVGPVTNEEADVLRCIDDRLAEIERATAAIEQLKADVGGLDQRLFDLGAPRAPIHRVPDDILREIFLAGAEPIPPGSSYPFSQHTCRLVCRRWSQVAVSCAPLWTNFSIDMETSQLTLVEERLEHLPETLPLSLELTCSEPSNTETKDDRAFEFTAWNLSRLRALRVSSRSMTCLKAIFQRDGTPANQPVTMLEELHLVLSENVALEVFQGPLDIRSLVALQHLSIRADMSAELTTSQMGPPILFSRNNWLRRLDFFGTALSSTQFCDILQDCPRLEEMMIWEAWFVGEDTPTLTSRKVSLRRLRKLRIYSPHFTESFGQTEFSVLELPALRCLDIWGADDDGFTLVPMLRDLRNTQHVRFLLSASLLRSVLRALCNDDRLLPDARDLHLDVCTRRWLPPFEGRGIDEWNKVREPPVLEMMPDFEQAVMAITNRRWDLMTKFSPSACLVLPQSAPQTLVESLQREGVRVETVQRDRTAWPGGW